MEQVWNGYGTDTQLNITFQVLHSMVRNRGVWNGSRGLDAELWIGVWIGMCARPCSGPFILSGAHIRIRDYIGIVFSSSLLTTSKKCRKSHEFRKAAFVEKSFLALPKTRRSTSARCKQDYILNVAQHLGVADRDCLQPGFSRIHHL